MGDSDFAPAVGECGQISESLEEHLWRPVFLDGDPSDERRIEVTYPDSDCGKRSPTSSYDISKEMLRSAFRKSERSFGASGERPVQDPELLEAFLGKNLRTARRRSLSGVSVTDWKTIFGAFACYSDRMFQDVDILDIAAMNGIEFSQPKWWRPGGYDKKSTESTELSDK